MSELPDVQETNSKILNDIQSLQNIEQELFNSLENPDMSPEQQEKIIKKVNDISQMRINLYTTLTGVNDYFHNALNNSRGTLTEQTNAIGILEKELNSSKKKLKILEEQKNNKIRLIEINDYYGQRYSEHSELMKIIIFMMLPIIVLALLNKYGILPFKIFIILMIIIVVIASFKLWKIFTSIITRDNLNYQEYSWYFNAATAPSNISTSDDPWATNTNLGTCIGENCCSEGQSYDNVLNMCVINNILTKNITPNIKPDITLGSDSVLPNLGSMKIT
jgi:hypothetical protein